MSKTSLYDCEDPKKTRGLSLVSTRISANIVNSLWSWNQTCHKVT